MTNRINNGPSATLPKTSNRELRESIVDRTPTADPEVAPLAGEMLPRLSDVTGGLGVSANPWPSEGFDSGIEFSRALAGAASTLRELSDADPAFAEAAEVVERYRGLRRDLALQGPLDL